MKVSELIAKLSELPGDVLVVQAKDAEGNGFSPTYAITSQEEYVAETEYSGELVTTFTAESDPCVVLWPTN